MDLLAEEKANDIPWRYLVEEVQFFSIQHSRDYIHNIPCPILSQCNKDMDKLQQNQWSTTTTH